jgi:hypothetical protein
MSLTDRRCPASGAAEPVNSSSSILVADPTEFPSLEETFHPVVE